MEPEVIAAIIGAVGVIIAAVVTAVWARRSSNGTERQVSPPDIPEQDHPEFGYTEHTVQPGETLWIIAELYYDGDGSQYGAIRKANPQIKSDNQTLYPGQKLRIPKDPDNAMPRG